MPPRNAQGKPGQRAGDVARFWYVQHRLKDLQEYYQLCGRIVTNSAVWGYSCRCDKTSDGLTFPQTCGIALATKQYQKASLARDFGFDLDRIDARIMGRHRETWVNHLEHDIAAGYVNMKNSPPPATKRKRTPDAPSPDLATLLNRSPQLQPLLDRNPDLARLLALDYVRLNESRIAVLADTCAAQDAISQARAL